MPHTFSLSMANRRTSRFSSRVLTPTSFCVPEISLNELVKTWQWIWCPWSATMVFFVFFCGLGDWWFGILRALKHACHLKTFFGGQGLMSNKYTSVLHIGPNPISCSGIYLDPSKSDKSGCTLAGWYILLQILRQFLQKSHHFTTHLVRTRARSVVREPCKDRKDSAVTYKTWKNNRTWWHPKYRVFAAEQNENAVHVADGQIVFFIQIYKMLISLNFAATFGLLSGFYFAI